MTLFEREPQGRRPEPLRYGVRHRPLEKTDEPAFRRLVPPLLVLAFLAVLVARGCRRGETRPAPIPPRKAESPTRVPPSAAAQTPRAETVRPPVVHVETPTNVPVRTRPRPHAETAWERKTKGWLATAASRPVEERMLLERLAEAERLGNDAVALDAVRRLMKSSVVADLYDDLALRLGQLNVKLLFSGAHTPWTKERRVRPGDNLQRIAREHRTTTASILKLNGLANADHLQPGQKLRVLDFPDATLVVRIEAQCADLMLKGRIFKRYLLKRKPHAATGNYPVTREFGPRLRFAALGLEFAPGEADEVALFLAPSSDVTVTLR